MALSSVTVHQFILKSGFKKSKLNVHDIYAHAEWIIHIELFLYFFLFFLPGRNIYFIKASESVTNTFTMYSRWEFIL